MRPRRWVVVASCLLMSLVVGYVTFFLAWSSTPRFTIAILPGAYIATAINKLLRLPGDEPGIWALFFGSHVFFWFVLFSAVAWAASRIGSGSRIGKPKVQREG